MTSIRQSFNIVGQSVSIRELLQQHNLSFPISLREVFQALRDRGSLIKHVFVLMLENRSFDHMLGFSGIAGTDAATGQPTTIDGLKGTESNTFEGRTFKVEIGAPDVAVKDPGHNFPDVLEQLCGPGATYPQGGPYPPINNSGYVSNYAKRDANSPGDAMKCFGPADLPVLNALAREFVVCDRWFSSMPGPTEPNRYFMLADTCGKFDESPTRNEIIEAVTKPGGGFQFKQGTVFKQLEKVGVKYRIYADDNFPVAAELDGVSVLFDIKDFEDFAKDLRKPSFDARFVLIEPDYSVVTLAERYFNGNSQHPRGSVAAGERFIKATYEAIRSSPVWEKSLLIILWDEHGGYYDHVPPPRAQETGEVGRIHGFVFDQLGPRVPALVVSPLIAKNLIDHKHYDHTAIYTTLRGVFNLPPHGERHGISGGVDHLVGFKARTDAPMKLPDAKASTSLITAITPPRPDALLFEGPPGLVEATIHSAVVQHLQVTPAEQHEAIRARARLLKTRGEAVAYLNEVEALVRQKRVQAGLVHA
jgi:phospholipase C